MNSLEYKDEIEYSVKVKRLFWIIIYNIIFIHLKPLFFNSIRVFLLKKFGATIQSNAIVYSSVKIWAPWNMFIGSNSCIGPRVNYYNQGRIFIGNNTIISQDSSLCASTHEITTTSFKLIYKDIHIGDNVWIAAEAFVGPGSIVSDGSVLGARAVLFGKTLPNTVYIGNPAKNIKNRYPTI